MSGNHVVEDQSDAVAVLADPATHGGAAVERVDTHGAMLFLAGDRAYKLKRAVRYPYMDFSTVERRAAACRTEVAINRRTAPQLYLGVEPIRRGEDGRARLDGRAEGVILDWVVVMRRFDGAALLDRLAERQALTPALAEGLAEAVADLHRQAAIDRTAGAAALRGVVEDNIAELREQPHLFAPAAVDRLEASAQAALDRLSPLLDRRAAAGFVRRCHGDLHLRNVVLLDGRPTLFDALEFDEALATIDVLYDLAFLLMDLEHRGLRGLANRVLNRYLELTADIAGLALLPLFLSTRAAVRAKVAASAAEVGADAAARSSRVEAQAYLAASVEFLAPAPPLLLAVGGLSGTGKTTVALSVAPGIGASPGALVLRSDVIRKELFGVSPRQRLPAEAYRPEVSARVFALIGERAGQVLAAGHAVVADAVYARPAERAAIAAVARRAGVPFVGVWLDAPPEVLRARIEARAAGRADASDADAAVVALQATYDLGPLSWRRIDAAGPPEVTAERVRAALPAT